MLLIFLQSLHETLFLVVCSGILAVGLGLPLGILQTNSVIKFSSNIIGSIPIVALMIVLIPSLKLMLHNWNANVIICLPLAIGGMVIFANNIHCALNKISPNLLQHARSMGASKWQMITKIQLPEILPEIILAIKTLLISLVGYSVIAGLLGAGGIGNVIYQYGYINFNSQYVFICIIILVLLIQAIQATGNFIANAFSKQ